MEFIGILVTGGIRVGCGGVGGLPKPGGIGGAVLIIGGGRRLKNGLEGFSTVGTSGG